MSPADETRVDYYWANKFGYRHNRTETLPTDWMRIRDDKGQDWVTINLDSRWNANPLPSAASQRQFTVMRMLQGKILESVRLPAGATIYSVPKTLKGTHDVFMNHLGVTWKSHPHDTLVSGSAWARETGKISAKLDGRLTLDALLAGGTFAAAHDVIIAYQEDRGATRSDLVVWPYWRRVLDYP